MLVDSIAAFLNAQQPLDHVRRLWRPDFGTQVSFVGGKERRIPTDGAGKHGEPYYYDGASHPDLTPETVLGIATNGWNYIDFQSEHWTFDLDSLVNHKKAGLPADRLQAIVDKLKTVPEAEIIRSKSGHGYHVRLSAESPPTAKTHAEHQRNSEVALAWLIEQTGIAVEADCSGVMAWIWHANKGLNGFELVKASERKLAELPKREPLPESPAPTVGEFSDRQNRLITWLAKHGHCTVDDAQKRVRTHSALLKQAHSTLRLRGKFETVAEGSKAGDHNCYMFPQTEAEGGGWTVYRYGDAHEPTWKKSAKGRVFTLLDSRLPKKEAIPDAILSLVEAAGDELFSGPDGRAYATLRYGDRVETWLVAEESYRAVLRRRYFKSAGAVVEDKHVKNAVAELKSIALLDRPQHEVAVRVAEREGALYLDLCNAARQAVKVTADGWQVIDGPPVRFRRNRSMLALPVPERGNIDLLRPFVNVNNDDWPLLVGFLLAALRPTGPYPVLILTGSPGAAKSSLSRVVQRLIDPNGGDVRAAPKTIEDLVIAAHNSWLIAYDNLSELSQGMSDSFCRLATGGGFGRRKLYDDEAETVFRSQRPCVLNSIRDVVIAPDLLDRSIVLDLDALANVQDEKTFWPAFEAVQPRVFGALLDGAAVALRDYDATKLADAPRLADFARWVSAGETSLGFAPGAILNAYRTNRRNVAEHTLDSDFAAAILKLAEQGFRDEPSRLPAALKLSGEWSPRRVADELRMLAPTLRHAGINVSRRKSNGKRLIEIQKS